MAGNVDNTARPKPENHGELSNKWVGAGHLKTGDKLRQADGTLGEVRYVNTITQTRTMYNLTVQEAHTFFVGNNGWLVHNASIDCPITGLRIINGRKPINHEYAGKTYPISQSLQSKYGIEGIQFSKSGFPDFSTVSKKSVQIDKFTGYGSDFSAADKLAGISPSYRQANNLTWHHSEDMQTMYLVPKDIHSAVRHTGGNALVK